MLDIIKKITRSSDPDYAHHTEILGSNSHDAANLDAKPLKIVKDFFKKKKKDYPDDTTIFKWKPVCFDNPEFGLEVLDYVASECISVVYSVRNPLDVYLSQMKHTLEPELKAHCSGEDTKCVEASRHFQMFVNEDSLIKDIKMAERGFARTLNHLQLRGIKFAQTSYDDLFLGSSDKRLEEWTKVINFLRPNFRGSKLTVDDITTSNFVMTHSSRNNTIENHDEIVSLLTNKYPRYAAFVDSVSSGHPFKNLPLSPPTHVQHHKLCVSKHHYHERSKE